MMHPLAALQHQWDEEWQSRRAVRTARLAMAGAAFPLRWLALPPLLLFADRIIAGLVAAGQGLGA